MNYDSFSDDEIKALYSKKFAEQQRLNKELFILGQKLNIDETEMQDIKSKILSLAEQERIVAEINENLKKRGI